MHRSGTEQLTGIDCARSGTEHLTGIAALVGSYSRVKQACLVKLSKG